jgi:probable rRNA maturation factor
MQPMIPQKEHLLDIFIMIEFKAWKALDFNVKKQIEHTLHASALIVSPWLEGAEVSVVLADDPMVKDLNAKYRGKNSPTNVLSFGDFEEPLTKEKFARHLIKPLLLGDIVLSYETLERESIDQTKSFRDHMSHLLVHGFLHLLGYDHQNEKDAARMEAIEIKILSSIGIENPYL